MDLPTRFASCRNRRWLLGACMTLRVVSALSAAEQIAPGRGEGILVAGPQVANPIGQLSADAIALESVDSGPPVKGAPYSAEAVTESIQTLADGNRIVRRTTALLYRDSRGRTRRETTLDGIAGLIVSGDPLRTVTVSDPESGLTYFIDRDKRVRVMRHRPGDTPPAPIPVGRGNNVSSASGSTTEESLGSRAIEGLKVEGTRTTLTIPAGTIGNERPITSVTERWFSPELRVVVLSRRADPRFGETTYRLTKVTRAEPPATLFDVHQ